VKPGEVFDPVDVTRRLKRYPVDAVDARRDIKDGPKRFYALLFRIAVTTDRRKNPWPGYLFPSEKFLAERLGKSESVIKRDLAVLRSVRLVRVERPDKTQNNRYFLLWDASFDGADVSGQEQPAVKDDSPEMSSRDSSHLSAQFRSDSANPSGHDGADVSGPYKEEQTVKANREAPANGSQGGFSEFQSAYPEPKREIKVDSACRAYISIIEGKAGEHVLLMAGLTRYKASADWQRSLSQNGGRYIPMMETFIFDRRYLDHPPAADEIPEDHPSASSVMKGRWDPITEQFLPLETVQ